MELLSLPTVTYLHLMMQKVQDLPFPACPQWRQKELLRPVPCHPVYNNLRIQVLQTPDHQIQVFFSFIYMKFAFQIFLCKICILKYMKKLKFYSLYISVI